MKTKAGHGTGSQWENVLHRFAVPGWVAAKLRSRPDREHELALYRLAIGGLAGCYLLVAASLEARNGRNLLPSIALLFAAFELASLGLLCHLLLQPGISAARRLAGILLDLGGLSYCMYIDGEMALPLYPLYLLAILANGFRFGTRYLLAAADMAVASLALVTVATQFFASHAGLSLGLLGGLIVPALQVCALTRRLPRHRLLGESPLRTNGAIATRVADPSDQGTGAAAGTSIGEAPDRQPPPDVRGSEEPGRRLAILVAEDNLTNQKVIAKILEKAGHELQMVDNGQAAAEAVAKGAFDVVLMDLEMPVLNGIEAAKLIRFLSTGRPRVPIVAMVTRADEETQRRCEEAGMDACIAKPIEPAVLIRVLDKAISPDRDSLSRSAAAAETAKPGTAAKPRPSPLDVRKLESLKALGGDDFVEELARQFIDDAAAVLGELSQAVAKGDAQAFREHAHALRSGAANIGAQGVYEMCLAWRRIDPATLSSKGTAYLQELEQEVGRVQAALQDYRECRAARKRSAIAAPQAQSSATLLKA